MNSEISELMENLYKESLIKKLNLNPEEEIKKLKGKVLFPIGSTYNNPLSYTLYDLVGVYLAEVFGEAFNFEPVIYIGDEKGLNKITLGNINIKENIEETYTTLIQFFKDNRKTLRKLRKSLYRNLNIEYRDFLTEILPIKTLSDYKKYIGSLFEKYWGKEKLKELSSEPRVIGVYNPKFSSISLRLPISSIHKQDKGIFKFYFKNSEESLKKHNSILDYLISNIIIQSKSFNDPYFLKDFVFKLASLDNKSLENYFQYFLNYNEQNVPFLPLGIFLYPLLLENALNNNYLLGLTNYTKPGEIHDFYLRNKEDLVIIPGLKILLKEKEGYKVINDLLVDNMKKGEILDLNKVLDNREEIEEQIRRQINSGEFLKNYSFYVVFKNFDN